MRNPFQLRAPWTDEYDATFQAGITALQTGRYADARASFERCLELSPGHTICAYNLACSFALDGDVERGLDWVQTAIEFGFGELVDGPTVLRKDPDLEGLRAHPRWRTMMGAMASERERSADSALVPARYHPPALRGAARLPLLVVLHAEGSSKEDVVTGPWREVADRLGMVLLAPSGVMPAGGGPLGERPKRWFREIGDYLDRPWAYEAPIVDSIRAFCDGVVIERSDVFIAGEGMGALLAANIALTAPGLFRGALLINGPLEPRLAGEQTRVAASVGLAIQVILDEREPVAARPVNKSLAALADELLEVAPAWGLASQLGVRHVPGEHASSPAQVRLDGIAALKRMLDDAP